MSPAVRRWLEANKPTARPRTQVLMAQLLWTLVGLGLCAAGLNWILQWAGPVGLFYAAPCVLLGLLKALLTLDEVARRTLGRIEARGDSRCALGFLSAKSWLLVGAASSTARRGGTNGRGASSARGHGPVAGGPSGVLPPAFDTPGDAI